MTLKKIIIIIVSVLTTIILVLVCALLVNNYLEQKRQQDIANRSGDFVKLWANFKDETSPRYLDSISKYLSSTINTDYADSANEIIGMRGQNPPVTSTFDIIQKAKVTKSNNDYNSIVVGNRNYSDERGRSVETLHLTWGLENNQYVITDLYSEGP